jgi:hypothetical protein
VPRGVNFSFGRFGNGPKHAAQCGEQIDHVEPGRRNGDAARLDFCQVEQVIHHFTQLAGRTSDEAHLLALFVCQRPIHFVDQQPGHAQDGTQWGAKLVTHVRKEAALQLRGLAQLFRLLVQLGIERYDTLIGFVQLGAQRVAFTAQTPQFFVHIVQGLGGLRHVLAPGQSP